MKLVTLTTSLEELEELVPLLREFHFYGNFEVLCLVKTRAESEFNANPCSHRRFREYAPEPLAKTETLKEKALVEVARRALLEERPDVILWPTQTFLKSALSNTVRLCGVGEYQLGQGSETSLETIIHNLRQITRAPPRLLHARPEDARDRKVERHLPHRAGPLHLHGDLDTLVRHTSIDLT